MHNSWENGELNLFEIIYNIITIVVNTKSKVLKNPKSMGFYNYCV